MSDLQNKNKKAHLFDKYATWNLVYTIVIFIAIIFWMIYGICYDRNKTFHDQLGGTWFYMTLGYTCCFGISVFFVNLYYSIRKIIAYNKIHDTQSIVIYSIGIVIPLMGCIYDLLDRQVLLYISNNLLENK